MEEAHYITHRLLFDICDVMTPVNEEKEPLYARLTVILHGMMFLGSGKIILPSTKDNLNDAIKDIIRLYRSIIMAFEGNQSTRIVDCLFTITHHMMIKYRNNIQICSRIACSFAAVIRDMDSWINYVKISRECEPIFFSEENENS